MSLNSILAQELEKSSDEVFLRIYGNKLEEVLKCKNWKLSKTIDRVYDCNSTFEVLEWRPVDTPEALMDKILNGEKVIW